MSHADLPYSELKCSRLAGPQQRACAQDVILRGGRQHPLFARVAEARAPPAWVMPAQPERGMQARPAGPGAGYVGCNLLKQRSKWTHHRRKTAALLPLSCRHSSCRCSRHS